MQSASCHPERPHHSRGLCRGCYKKATAAGTLSQHARTNGQAAAWLEQWLATIERGEIPGTCVLWPHAVNSKGYPCIAVNGRSKLVTRVLYARIIGDAELDPAIVVMHGCDRPRCVNPMHLCRGTGDENMADMVRKGRQARGQSNGRAVLTAADVRVLRKHAEQGQLPRLARTARELGLSPRALHSALTGETWAHLP